MSLYVLNAINIVGCLTGYLLLCVGGYMVMEPDRVVHAYAAFAPFCLTLGSLGIVASAVHLWRRNR